MLVRIAKRLNPDLGLHCLPLHFWQKINAWKLSIFTIDLCRVKSRNSQNIILLGSDS